MLYNAIQMPYTSSMKIKKTIRLSDKAIEILDGKENQSQYIEDLILGVHKLDETANNDETLAQQINAMELRLMEALEKSSATQNPVPVTSTRGPQDILADIKNKELELNTLLQESQDPEDHKKLQLQIQQLWAEYHVAKTDMWIL